VCSNFAAAIESVPNYKMFSVFGKTGLMEYSDVVKVMDVGSMSWEDPTVEGTKPPAREDMAVCYDPKLCRLFFHGGWANRWMEDLWTLNVSPIIGPPYATLSVSPIIGPVRLFSTAVLVAGLIKQMDPWTLPSGWSGAATVPERESTHPRCMPCDP
jgi:dynein heavy chain